MTKVALHQGAYLARSPIANAQVAFNVYPEPNPQDAPFPVTHYPAPGSQVLSDYSGTFPGEYIRGIYAASNGQIFFAVGTSILQWNGPDPAEPTGMGSMPTNSGLPVTMCDNGVDLVVTDGSPWGGIYQLGAPPGSFATINDPAFYGSSRVDYIDTFMIFNQPGTGNFYTTTSGVVLPFDATYAAAKEGWNDHLAVACCLHDNIWLLGDTTTEIWYNAGGTTFPFARMPNSVLQQGCIAPYSAVVADNALYWLSQDRWGRNMMMRGEGYMAKRVSTFAVEDAWRQYPTLNDAVGMAYQIGGHETIGIYFPSGNAWWAYDASTQMWHQRTYGDLSTPWLPYCMAGWTNIEYVAQTPNAVIAGDRTAPRILQVSEQLYTDAVNTPIQRQRSWVHTQQDGNRLAHTRFSISFAGAQLSPDTLELDWSDDAGQTYGTAVPQTIDNQTNGQYQWRRLGYARDRVYRLTWSGLGECALNGAYVDILPQGT